MGTCVKLLHRLTMLVHLQEGVTDEDILEAIRCCLLEDPCSGRAAYVSVLRATADRSGVSKDRRLVEVVVQVRP